MKQLLILLAFVVGVNFTSQAQKVIFSQDFESSSEGTNVKALQKNKLTTWSGAQFTVSENKGKGNNSSNKFASSHGTENAAIVLYRDLEVGATYVFSVAVKMTEVDGKSVKANYTINATSGKKGDMHRYGQEKVEPKGNNWKVHKLEFTVVEGREKVALNVYRWAKDATLNVDDFQLIKK